MSIGAGPGVSSFPNGFANGVNIRGVPLVQTHPGKAIWLGNGNFVAPQGRGASDGNGGGFNSPCSTLAGALGKCQAGRGDMILVKPGHFERISTATALNMNVSGVAVVGLGSGQLRPKFVLDTVVGATVNILADDISFSNCQFAANLANITAAFTLGIVSFTGVIAGTQLTASSVTGTIVAGQQITGTGVTTNTYILSQSSGTAGGAGVYIVSISQTVGSTTITTTSKGFTLDNCDVTDNSAILNFLSCVVTSTTSNAHDQLTISRNRVIFLVTSGVVNLLSALGTNDRVIISDNYYQATTTGTGAIIPIAAGKIITGLLLLRNFMNVVNAAATATGIWITTNGTTNTGFIHGNFGHGLPNTTLANSLLVTATSGIQFGQNGYARSADKSVTTALPAVDT